MTKYSVILFVVLSGCQQASSKSECVASMASAVLDGTETQTHPAVGLLKIGNGTCTGTLIGPNKVLTAMHCIEDLEPEDIVFQLEDEDGEVIHSVQGIAFTRSTMWRDPRATRLEDIGLVHLARNIVDVTPVDVSRDEVGVGERLTIVGYGNNRSFFGGGTKRIGIITVEEVRPGSFVSGGPQGSCSGDSGGPVLRETDDGFEQVGITSAGGNCDRDSISSLSNRVDVFEEFIANTVEPTFEVVSVPTVFVGQHNGETLPNVEIRVSGGGLVDALNLIAADGTVFEKLEEGIYTVEASHAGLGLTASTECRVMLPITTCRIDLMASDSDLPLCSDECQWAGDGICDDGGDGSEYAVCAFATDCGDCGERDEADAPEDRPFDSAACGN